MIKVTTFEQEYKKLNQAQCRAVDLIEGPVMVVAGPGTGKTQVLSLRIANILQHTDVGADAVLCLTFTNSGVKAMKERLRRYIGGDSARVNVHTFHSFGLKMIEEYHAVLGLDKAPSLLSDEGTIVLFDHLFKSYDWEYLRPRADGTRYFKDLKSLISLLKREGIKSHDFGNIIKKEIENIEKDPASIATRGENKGELKKEVQKKIESLSRILEVVEFYRKYEKLKKEGNFFDYDDVLENLVNIVEYSDDARADIKEKFLYVLVDEHQDSSAIQNKFLEIVWAKEEKPNVFVVGDDRQLIYGFGGASLEYFEGFKNTFPEATLITLTENYRSTQKILDVSHVLLKSKIAEAVLSSNQIESHPLRLFECDYERDEIIMAGQDILEYVKKHNIDLDNCAILVPKNKHVASAVRVLRDLGIKASSKEAMNLFDCSEAISFINVLKVLADPYDSVTLSQTFFDSISNIPPLSAHKFTRENDMKKFSLEITKTQESLFDVGTPEEIWLEKLRAWLALLPTIDLYGFLQKVGDELLLQTARNHDELSVRVEVVRTLLHLALAEIERNPRLGLKEFLESIDRLAIYGARIPLAVFSRDHGVKVMTLHASKGLEFDYVWIAHMDEVSFERGKKAGFTLPTEIAALVEEKDEEVLKRELYVAITRAKRFCNISYARFSYDGRDRILSTVVSGITDNLFEKVDSSQVESKIMENGIKSYVQNTSSEVDTVDLSVLQKIVSQEYTDKLVSVSLLNNFFECPWKWYFRNLLQLPEPLSDSLDYGSKVHSVIDKILKMNRVPNEDTLYEIADGQKEVIKLVKFWIENDLPKVALKRDTEKSISLKDERFPHLTIYGKIDLIEHVGDSVEVTDFKTGSAKKKIDIEKHDEEGRLSNMLRQLAMYSYLLKENPKWKAHVSKSRLLFLEAKNNKDRYYDTSVNDEDIDLLIRDIKDYDNLLLGGEWVSRPCNFNSYGKANAECAYCKLSEIYKK